MQTVPVSQEATEKENKQLKAKFLLLKKVDIEFI